MGFKVVQTDNQQVVEVASIFRVPRLVCFFFAMLLKRVYVC